jgi:hypothetical protein
MRDEKQHLLEFSDFTEENYRSLLRLAKRKYVFAGYNEAPAGPHVFWRHDLDASMNRSLRLAQIEHEEGVVATYFLFPRCLYYNLLNPLTHALIRQIIELGHEIALHFDPTHFGKGLTRERLIEAIAAERDLLKREFGAEPTAVSFHLYGVLEEPMPDDDELAGLVNAYSKRLRDTYGYVSDSNGIWLHRRLQDVLTEAHEDRLQVLTHPEWWTAEVMPPRVRLQCAIDDYARVMGRWYDETVAKSGRPNLR